MAKRESVTLNGLPPGFVDDLPKEDQLALSAQVGKRVALNGYDEDDRAELEFRDSAGLFHTIWVDPKFMTKKQV
jgi:hypothetical protein